MLKNVSFLILILITLLCGGRQATAQPMIITLQSFRVKPYDQAFQGFINSCRIKTKRFIISESGEADLEESIKKAAPEMILAIGSQALSKAALIENIPIFYMMALNPDPFISNRRHVTGIGMNVSARDQLEALLKVLPDTKKVGLLFDPARTFDFVRQAVEAASQVGIELFAEKVSTPKQVPGAMGKIRQDIEVFWMIPDLTVLTPETIEFLLLSLMEKQVPVLSFSEKYLEMGALMAVGIDPFDIGRQAGEIVCRLFAGSNAKLIGRLAPRKAVVTINQMVARKLGMNIDPLHADGTLIIR